MDLNKKYLSEDIVSSLFYRYPELVQCKASIDSAIDIITDAYKNNRKLLICGNGGSASDSEHIVGELMKSFMFKRDIDSSFSKTYKELFDENPPFYIEGSLPAISLVSQTSLTSAFSNDESAEGIFAQQVYGYGQSGDVLVAISTSGKSKNVIEAAKTAKAKNMSVVSLTGATVTELNDISNVAINVPRYETYQVQELHLPVYHCICAAVEARMF